MPFISPLRYPGGKGLLLDFISSVIQNTMSGRTRYVEPFAGGAGVALGLLAREIVEHVTIGDLDPAIGAFWHSVFHRNDEFCERVQQCPVTIDDWHLHWDVINSDEVQDGLELGFAAFFLNRTNRSGILRARPIGGLAQNGDWKLDCRFNKDDLTRRIRALKGYRDRVAVCEGDARDLLGYLKETDPELVFIYADPPYLMKSADLYLDQMSFEAHMSFANRLQSQFEYWMVSYDQDRRVSAELFPIQDVIEFSIRHSASRSHIGAEVAVFSKKCHYQNSLVYLKSPVRIR